MRRRRLRKRTASERRRSSSGWRRKQAKAQADADAQRALEQQRAAEAASAAAAQQAQAQVAAAEAEKARLREQLRAQLNQVLETRESAGKLIVNMSDVLFDFGKFTLKPGAKEKLAKISGILISHPGLTLEVDGHTDSVGSDEFQFEAFGGACGYGASVSRVAGRSSRTRFRRMGSARINRWRRTTRRRDGS